MKSLTYKEFIKKNNIQAPNNSSDESLTFNDYIKKHNIWATQNTVTPDIAEVENTPIRTYVPNSKKISLTKDYYGGKTKIAWPYSNTSSLDFAKGTNTVLPSSLENPSVVKDKISIPEGSWNKFIDNLRSKETAVEKMDRWESFMWNLRTDLVDVAKNKLTKTWKSIKESIDNLKNFYSSSAREKYLKVAEKWEELQEDRWKTLSNFLEIFPKVLSPNWLTDLELNKKAENLSDEILNTPTLKGWLAEFAWTAWDIWPAAIAWIKSLSKNTTLNEAIQDTNKYLESGDLNFVEKIMSWIMTSWPEVVLWIAIGIAAKNPKASIAYWSALSAWHQAEEWDIKSTHVAIDTALDMPLWNAISKMFSSTTRKSFIKSFSEGWITEGWTEVAQTFIKAFDDFAKAETPEERQVVIDNLKDYILSWDMWVEFLSSALIGWGTEAGLSTLQWNQDTSANAKNNILNVENGWQSVSVREEKEELIPNTNDAVIEREEAPVASQEEQVISIRDQNVANLELSLYEMDLSKKWINLTERKKTNAVKKYNKEHPEWVLTKEDFDRISLRLAEISAKTWKDINNVWNDIQNMVTRWESGKTIYNTLFKENPWTTQSVEQTVPVAPSTQSTPVDSNKEAITVNPIERTNEPFSAQERTTPDIYVQPKVKTEKVRTENPPVQSRTVAWVNQSEKKVVGETPAQIKKRLKIEKENYNKWAEITVDYVKPSSKFKVKTAAEINQLSDYEQWLYYRELEIEEARLKNEKNNKKKEAASKDKTTAKAEKLKKEYDKLSDEELSDENLLKMDDVRKKYEALTWKDIWLDESYIQDIDDSSVERKVTSDYEWLIDDVIDDWAENIWEADIDRDTPYSEYDSIDWPMALKKKGRLYVWDEETRVLSWIEQEIKDIDWGKKTFTVPEETVKVVRKAWWILTENMQWTEWHSIGRYIGQDSLNNVFMIWHELFHLLSNKKWNKTMDNLLKNPLITLELRDLFVKYYPWGKKIAKTANPKLVYNEWAAEFIRWHLFNPSKISEEFPALTEAFFWENKVVTEDISEMYSDLNKIIYVYQNISSTKKRVSMSVSNMNVKTAKVKSTIIGKWWRLITNTQNSIYPLRVLDWLTVRWENVDTTKNFKKDSTWRSLEEMWARHRDAGNIAKSNLDPTNDKTRILTPEWTLKEVLNFSIGWFLQEITDNEDVDDYWSYLDAMNDQRDIDRLKEYREELLSLYTQIEYETEIEADKKEIKSLKRKAAKIEKEIKRFEWIVKTQLSPQDEITEIIKREWPKFAKYQERMDAIWKMHLDLQVESWKITREYADEMTSRPWYTPSNRFIINELETHVQWFKTSVLWKQLAPKTGSKAKKPTINPILLLPTIHLQTMNKYSTQMFHNELYKRLNMRWLAQKNKSTKVNEPGNYTYTHNGKRTWFIVMDPMIEAVTEDIFWMKSNETLFEEILRKSARIFQKWATQYNPYFQWFKNLWLDIPISFIMSETWYIPVISQLSRYWKQYFNEWERNNNKRFIKEYDLMWWASDTIYRVDPSNKNPINTISHLDWKKTRIQKILWWARKWAEKLVNATERFTRLEEFVRARKKWDSVSEAYEKSKNVSFNFGKTWLISKRVTRLIPFSNAGIQVWAQTVQAMKDPWKRKRLLKAMVISSAITLSRFLKLVRDIDDAEDSDERDEAMNQAYRFLDKSMYQKLNFFSLWEKSKFASNSLLSAPGNFIWLLMLEKRVPEYDINYAEFWYEVLNWFLPSQVTPDLWWDWKIGKSIAGKVAGSLPILNTIFAMAWYRTFPSFSELETSSDAKKNPENRYEVDTNNLAILLWRMSNTSPKKWEAMIKSVFANGWDYASDIVWSILMPDSMVDNLDILDKWAKEVLFTSPTKSSISQDQRTVSWETSEKLYSYSSFLERQKDSLEREAKNLLREYWVEDGSELPSDVKASIEAKYYITKKKLSFVNKTKNARLLVSEYEKRDKKVPMDLKLALHKFILWTDSWDFEKLTKEDLKVIEDANKAYWNKESIDWDLQPDNE